MRIAGLRPAVADGEAGLQIEDKMSTIEDIMSSIGLLDVISSRTRQAVLKELLVPEDAKLHLREIERRTGMNSRGLQRVLSEFVKAGLIVAERSGNRLYYHANRRCPIYPELRMILIKTIGLADILYDALVPFRNKIRLAYIYGSFAAGKAGSGSDVDLMIVGKVSRKALATPLANAQRLLAREINASIFQPEEYSAKLKEKGGFIAQVHAGPKIIIMGEPDELG